MISRSGVRFGNFSGSISLNGGMVRRSSTSTSAMLGSNAASKRCGRSTMWKASGIEDEVRLWPADAREAGTGLRLRIRRLEIADAAGLDRDDARTATARATAGVDSHPLRLRELQQVLRGWLPPNILSRPTECDVQFRHHRRLAWRRWRGLFLHRRGTESFKVNILVRHAPRLQAVGDALHERAVATEEILEVARRQQFLHQLGRHTAFVVKVAALHVAGAGAAVADVEADVVVVGGELLDLVLEHVLGAIAHAVEKPDLALLDGRRDRAGHAHHRGHADAAGDKNDGILL